MQAQGILRGEAKACVFEKERDKNEHKAAHKQILWFLPGILFVPAIRVCLLAQVLNPVGR